MKSKFRFEGIYYGCGVSIKEFRIKLHLTQSQLADLVGVSKNSISLFERDLMNPSLTVLMRLSSIFDCPVESLVDTYTY